MFAALLSALCSLLSALYSLLSVRDLKVTSAAVTLYSFRIAVTVS
jgi:hypothetical protein